MGLFSNLFSSLSGGANEAILELPDAGTVIVPYDKKTRSISYWATKNLDGNKVTLSADDLQIAQAAVDLRFHLMRIAEMRKKDKELAYNMDIQKSIIRDAEKELKDKGGDRSVLGLHYTRSELNSIFPNDDPGPPLT